MVEAKQQRSSFLPAGLDDATLTVANRGSMGTCKRAEKWIGSGPSYRTAWSQRTNLSMPRCRVAHYDQKVNNESEPYSGEGLFEMTTAVYRRYQPLWVWRVTDSRSLRCHANLWIVAIPHSTSTRWSPVDDEGNRAYRQQNNPPLRGANRQERPTDDLMAQSLRVTLYTEPGLCLLPRRPIAPTVYRWTLNVGMLRFVHCSAPMSLIRLWIVVTKLSYSSGMLGSSCQLHSKQSCTIDRRVVASGGGVEGMLAVPAFSENTGNRRGGGSASQGRSRCGGRRHFLKFPVWECYSRDTLRRACNRGAVAS